MSYFRFIEKNIDTKIINNILSEIRKKDWHVAGKLPGAAGMLDPYGFLPLTMAVVKTATDDPKDTELTQNTPMFYKYKETRKWLESWNCENHSRCAFFKMLPGGSLGMHIDEGKYYLSRDRYHLSLQGTYEYTVGNEMHIIEPGTFFWFDNKIEHMSHNISSVHRISLVFDVPHRGPDRAWHKLPNGKLIWSQ